MHPILTERTLHPGMIPVELNAARGELRWMDLGAYHSYHGFFRDGLAEYSALRSAPPAEFLSGLDALGLDGIQAGCIAPTGFIFHAGRCGSTLLAKVLARSRSNLVFSEAQPHNEIWQTVQTGGGVDLYRALLIAMGRRRLPSYTSHIVKFSSFNIMQFEFIRKAFPGVPALFLSRKPEAIVASMRREVPAWMGRDLGLGHVWQDAERAVADFLDFAGRIQDPLFHRLDYSRLGPDRLSEILRFFNIEASAGDLRAMTAEFAWDSKRLRPTLKKRD